ncbi:MAG: murein hydrolase activator EnvC family protein [Bacteroidia bacterium]
MNKLNKYIVLLVTFFFLHQAFAQTKKELENKKKQLQKEIKQTESLLNETKKNKKLSLNQLVTLNKKISIREQLITTIQAEIRLAEKQIKENKEIIASLENDLKKLKEEYAKMIYYAYKNQDAYSRIMFIFSAKDFSQAYRRLKYMQQYSFYRQKQAEMIEKTQELLNKKVAELEDKKRQKQQLLGIEEQEKQVLAKEKTEQEKTLSQLQEQEKELLKKIKEKEQEQKQLQLAIQRIIEEEIRKSREKAKSEGTTPAEKGLTLTPEAQKLSNTFEANKGKLPWPVAEGIITGKHGEQPHPVLKGITIKNNGVDISTKKDAPVRAVFDGEVTGLATIPGFGKVVMIRHGEYLTVYSNLRDVFVKKGDKIKTKQNIAVVDTDENGKTEVHFEIWKGSTLMNPETWLYLTSQ